MLKGKNLNLEVNFLGMIKFLKEIIDKPENVSIFLKEKEFPLGQTIIIDSEVFWLAQKRIKNKFIDISGLEDKVELKGIVESYERDNLLIKWEDGSKSWVYYTILSKI